MNVHTCGAVCERRGSGGGRRWAGAGARKAGAALWATRAAEATASTESWEVGSKVQNWTEPRVAQTGVVEGRTHPPVLRRLREGDDATVSSDDRSLALPVALHALLLEVASRSASSVSCNDMVRRC